MKRHRPTHLLALSVVLGGASCDALIGANFGDYQKGGEGAGSSSGGSGGAGGGSGGAGGTGGGSTGGSGGMGGAGGASQGCPGASNPMDPTWAKSFGGSGIQQAWEIAVAPSGDVILAGDFEGTVDFGGGERTANGAERTLFVVALDQCGDYRWDLVYPDSDIMTPRAISLDGNGNIAVGGHADGHLALSLSTPGTVDGHIFVVSLDPDGNVVFEKHFGTSNSEQLEDVKWDGLGRLLLAGSFTDDLDVGGCLLSEAGFGIHGFVARLSVNGTCQTSRTAGAGDGDAASVRALAVNDTHALAFGDFEGQLVDPLSPGNSFTSNGRDLIAMTFAIGDLVPASAEPIGGPGDQVAVDAIDLEESAWVTLSTTTAQYTLVGGQMLGANGSQYGVLLKHTANLASTTGESFGGSGVNVDAESLGGCDSLLGITGTLVGAGDVTFPSGPFVLSSDPHEAFVTTFDFDLQAQQAVLYQSDGLALGESLSFDASCTLHVAGAFNDSIDFGTTALSGAADSDVFVARLPAAP